MKEYEISYRRIAKKNGIILRPKFNISEIDERNSDIWSSILVESQTVIEQKN